MVKDTTADYSTAHMHAALEVNIPNYASAIVPPSEVVESMAALAGHSSVARETYAQ